MKIELKTTLIACAVSLLSTLLTIFLSYKAIESSDNLWLRDLYKTKELEILKVRLDEYPKILIVLQNISSKANPKLTPMTADSLGYLINDWWYSKGGLIASSRTRGALKNLRNACFAWNEGDSIPLEIKEWRDISWQFLRCDLDFKERESFDFEKRDKALEEAKNEMENIISKESK